MVKSYLKYDFYGSAAIITSHGSNIVCWPPHPTDAKAPLPVIPQRSSMGADEAGELAGFYDDSSSSMEQQPMILSPGLEMVTCWNSVSGFLEGTCIPDEDVAHAEVTALALSHDGTRLAIGYRNGGLSVRQYPGFESIFTSVQHKPGRAVTSIAWDRDGVILATGSLDTDIILWDVSAQEPIQHLRGHVGTIVGLCFLTENLLLSAASLNDGSLRVWDLQLKDCIHQVLTGVKDLSCIGVDPDHTRVLCGGKGKDIHVYNLEELPEKPPKEHGVIHRQHQAQAQINTIKFHMGMNLVGIQGSTKHIELWRFVKSTPLSLEEVAAEQENPKKKRKYGKHIKTVEPGPIEDDEGGEAVNAWSEQPPSVTFAASEFEPFKIITTEYKIRSFDWLNDGLVLSSHMNTLERWRISADPKVDPSQFATIKALGHRLLICACAQSHDDLLMATVSDDVTLIWNVRRAALSCTLPDAKEGTCVKFLQGNRHIVLGTKSGQLSIFSLSTASLVHTLQAHQLEINNISLRPDQRGLISAGKDNKTIIWNYGIETDPELGTKHLTLVEHQSLELTDAAMDVEYTLDGTKFAVAMQDCTIRTYFADTLKFQMTMYGHKLPVTSISISSDGELLISGSMDKNIKIWGMVFGECRKSIFAHDKYVTGVRFCMNTHYFFSCSSDGTLKYWDADSFQLIQIIRSHIEGILCMSVNSDASLVMTAGHDRSVRAFFRTEEMIVANEQRDQDIEKAEDEEMAARLDTGAQKGAAGHQTPGSLRAGELLEETITLVEMEIAREEEQKKTNSMPEAPNPLLFGKTPLGYLVSRLEQVKAFELPHAIGLLPFHQCCAMLRRIHALLELQTKRRTEQLQDAASANEENLKSGGPPIPTIPIELATRVCFLILQLHGTFLVQQVAMVPVVEGLRTMLRDELQHNMDRIGFNIAGLTFLQRKIEADQHVQFFNLSKRLMHKKPKRPQKASKTDEK